MIYHCSTRQQPLLEFTPRAGTLTLPLLQPRPQNTVPDDVAGLKNPPALSACHARFVFVLHQVCSRDVARELVVGPRASRSARSLPKCPSEVERAGPPGGSSGPTGVKLYLAAQRRTRPAAHGRSGAYLATRFS